MNTEKDTFGQFGGGAELGYWYSRHLSLRLRSEERRDATACLRLMEPKTTFHAAAQASQFGELVDSHPRPRESGGNRSVYLRRGERVGERAAVSAEPPSEGSRDGTLH